MSQTKKIALTLAAFGLLAGYASAQETAKRGGPQEPKKTWADSSKTFDGNAPRVKNEDGEEAEPLRIDESGLDPKRGADDGDEKYIWVDGEKKESEGGPTTRQGYDERTRTRGRRDRGSKNRQVKPEPNECGQYDRSNQRCRQGRGKRGGEQQPRYVPPKPNEDGQGTPDEPSENEPSRPNNPEERRPRQESPNKPKEKIKIDPGQRKPGSVISI
ncbi:MAG: hypothetical protein HYT79_07005 [Elusimicrobia bacterium]|nr:hypothetical protein [Elusimicrobiota bacterium]